MVYSFFVVFAEVYRFCGALLWMAAKESSSRNLDYCVLFIAVKSW
jgi:hypothetical protein